MIRVLAVAAVAFFGLFVSAAAGQTDNSSRCAQPGQPSGAPQYPPQCAAPSANPASVRAGQATRFTGQCPVGSSTADFRLQPGGTSLGSAPTNAEGRFDASLTIPSSTTPGTYTIEYRCNGVQGAQFQRGATVEVLGSAAAAGTLPRTGTGLTTPLAASAVLLIGAGAVAVVASRRRRA